ncbi:sensor histidine kinase [Paractinoplanes abujensis]|uniref:histidine kinase n=1 Tax=Paractinoplanes abujensis TaxID=882441 RepID=A0A7W7CK67_9ACTN|nr:histidine kinase [Actinoplanes abujensis]MBB4689985.1 signal transduction histidine kinase [Actinoplanes abujensis]
MPEPGIGEWRRGLRRDLLIAGLSVAGAVVLTVGAFDGPAGLRWRLLGVAVVAAVAAGLVRTRPVTGVLVGGAAVLVDQVIGPSLATVLIYTQVLYDAGVHGPRRLARVLLWAGAMLTVAVTVLHLAGGRGQDAAVNGVLVALILIVPVTTGMSVREWRDRSAADRRHAEQVARLAAMDDRRAVAAERTRMARELHDVVANHLSVVAIHSTGALAAADPALRERALTVIRDHAVQGLAELRESIRVLRLDETALPGVEVGLDEVPALAERVRRTGLDVRVTTTGARRPLPIAVDMAAYRIVQESLTNAVKHGGDTVTLGITYGPGVLTVTVSNPVGVSSPDGSGAGLIGMRERASLLGGTFDAGAADGVFLVRVSLPTPKVSA